MQTMILAVFPHTPKSLIHQKQIEIDIGFENMLKLSFYNLSFVLYDPIHPPSQTINLWQ